jgi:hypothetical protein
VVVPSALISTEESFNQQLDLQRYHQDMQSIVERGVCIWGTGIFSFRVQMQVTSQMAPARVSSFFYIYISEYFVQNK